MMKFLQIGLGSMGKRRIRNLQFNGEKILSALIFQKNAEKKRKKIWY